MTKDEAIQVLLSKPAIAPSNSERQKKLNEAIDVAIESLSAETEWIPCSERLPKVGQDVLFCDGEWTEEGYMMGDGNWIQFRWSTFRGKDEVTAWMPLPKPYEKRREEINGFMSVGQAWNTSQGRR